MYLRFFPVISLLFLTTSAPMLSLRAAENFSTESEELLWIDARIAELNKNKRLHEGREKYHRREAQRLFWMDRSNARYANFRADIHEKKVEEIDQEIDELESRRALLSDD